MTTSSFSGSGKSIREIIAFLEDRAPSATAEPWDNVGLILGDPEWKTRGAVVSDDLTWESIEAAERRGFRLILNHHPCIFGRGLSRVTAEDGGIRAYVFEALRRGIAVAACHTNFDRCALEVGERVAQGLGISRKGRLFEAPPAASQETWTKGQGYGVWGDLKEPQPFSDLAQRVKRLFNIDGYWMTDPPPGNVKRVAFVAGKGASFTDSARALGCDLFITGEAGYHVALEGARQGMGVMELGHRESEFFFLEVMSEWLSGIGLETETLNVPTQRVHSS